MTHSEWLSDAQASGCSAAAPKLTELFDENLSRASSILATVSALRALAVTTSESFPRNLIPPGSFYVILRYLVVLLMMVSSSARLLFTSTGPLCNRESIIDSRATALTELL